MTGRQKRWGALAPYAIGISAALIMATACETKEQAYRYRTTSRALDAGSSTDFSVDIAQRGANAATGGVGYLGAGGTRETANTERAPFLVVSRSGPMKVAFVARVKREGLNTEHPSDEDPAVVAAEPEEATDGGTPDSGTPDSGVGEDGGS
jgi:hypothetical protein